MLDDHDRQLGAARHRILHPEHDDRLVDHHELQRQPRDEARLLPRLDEAAHPLGRVGIVEDRELVHASRLVRLRDLEPLDVLLRRSRVRRLREDENLALDAACSSSKRSLIARRSRKTSMYSSGSVCSFPAWKAGLSSSISAARRARARRAPRAASDTSRSSASSGATAAYLAHLPGRVDAGPCRRGSRARRRCAGAGRWQGAPPAPAVEDRAGGARDTPWPRSS